MAKILFTATGCNPIELNTSVVETKYKLSSISVGKISFDEFMEKVQEAVSEIILAEKNANRTQR